MSKSDSEKKGRGKTELLNPWHVALEQLDATAEYIKLDEAIHAVLRHPQRILMVSVPVQMDDGREEVFQVLEGMS